MTKEIELAAEKGAKARYPQNDCMCLDELIHSDTNRLVYQTGFKDCAQWMATRDRWVSVSERLPDDERWVQVKIKNDNWKGQHILPHWMTSDEKWIEYGSSQPTENIITDWRDFEEKYLN